MFDKIKDNKIVQQLDFKFSIGSLVKTSSGKIGKVCLQMSKDFKKSYDILVDKNTIEYDLKEFELVLA